MKRKAILLPSIAGLILAVAFIGMADFARANASPNLAAGGREGHEMELNASGGAFEINQDAQGRLYISDYFGDEIWRVDPAGQVYTAYHNIPAPSDAREDGAGGVWWVEVDTNRLGRLALATLEVDYWEIPSAINLYGTGIDASGSVWATDYNEDHFYSFEPSASQVCTYTVSGMVISDYLYVQGNDLWFGDIVDNRIYRLDTNSDLYTYWEIPFGIYPEGMLVDENGTLWWADILLNELIHLDPEADLATHHAPPIDSSPAFLTIAGEQLWYTDWDGRLGIFSTDVGGGVSSAVEEFTVAATSDCSLVEVVESKTITSTSGIIGWTASSYPSLLSSAGWSIYELPVEGFPWGIQATEDFIYFVDNGRQVLGRVPIQDIQKVYLPLVSR